MRKHLLDGAVAVLVICAVVVTALVVRRTFFTGTEAPDRSFRLRSVEDWRGYLEGGHRRGPGDAPVQIVVFSDFQCPFCRDLSRRLERLRGEYGREVAVVYRHFPLARHPRAREAAVGAECAARQGRFWAFHDRLFAQQDSIGQKPWRRFAREVGVEAVKPFVRCVSRRETETIVVRDSSTARRLGARGTPTLLINDQLYRGALPFEVLKSEVERALEG